MWILFCLSFSFYAKLRFWALVTGLSNLSMWDSTFDSEKFELELKTRESAQVSRRSSPQRLEHGIKRAATLQALAVSLKQCPRELPNGHLGREQPRDRRP